MSNCGIFENRQEFRQLALNDPFYIIVVLTYKKDKNTN